MALNYSYRPIFPAHTSEDNLVSPLRIVNGYVVEGITENGGERFAKHRHGNGEMNDLFGYGTERIDKSGSPDLESADSMDLLPSDPFGMDIGVSTTFTAINGWLEDFEVDSGTYVRNNIANTNVDYESLTGFNVIWNGATRFQSFSSNEAPDDKGGAGYMVDNCTTGCQFRGLQGEGMIYPVHYADDTMGFNHCSTSTLVTRCEDLADDFGHSPNAVGGDPHDAFVLALTYLGTRDHLSVERVCRSLCSTIRNDSLLWRSIHIDQPLNERITDDILVRLTSRAEGNLRCLTLIKCPRITDDGLKRVLESNPKLTKLAVPGCTRLSINGILNNLKAFKSNKGTSGIKHIRTGGFFGITHEHFKELKFLLSIGGKMPQNDYSPRYYNQGNSYLASDDERDIDVEECPRCENLRLVYDCPAESCGGKDQCRACVICIPRCACCGRCVHNTVYEETFSLDCLCSSCLKELPRCQQTHWMEVDVFDVPSETVCRHG